MISNLGGILLYSIVSTVYTKRTIALSALMSIFLSRQIYFMRC